MKKISTHWRSGEVFSTRNAFCRWHPGVALSPNALAWDELVSSSQFQEPAASAVRLSFGYHDFKTWFNANNLSGPASPERVCYQVWLRIWLPER